MARKVKSPIRVQEPSASRPRFPKGLLEIREVKTPEERQGYNRIVFSNWKQEQIELRDSHFTNHRRFIACFSGKVVGTGMLAELPQSGKHAILRVAVDERFSDPILAIAKRISQRIEEEAKKMGLTELISFCSERLMRIYQRFAGYEPVEERHNDPEGPYWVIKKKLD